MYYLQSRYYDPELCRFISADDFAYINTDTPMSVNVYAYCINNPLKYFDPSGCYVISNNEKTDNWLEAVLKVLVIGIEGDAFTRIFEGIVQSVNKSFDLNKWFNTLSEFTQNLFENLTLGVVMVFNKVFNLGKDIFDFEKLSNLIQNKTFSELGNYIFESFTSLGRNVFSLWGIFADSFNGLTDGNYTGVQALSKFILNAAILAITIWVPVTPTRILMTTLITNIILDFKIDFDNGHFWG